MPMINRILMLCAIFAGWVMSFTSFAQSEFVQVKDGQFLREGKAYYFVGTNYWYGP